MARKKQGYKARLDESLGERRGKESGKKQSYKARRHESEAMERHYGRRPYAAVSTMDMGSKKRKKHMDMRKEMKMHNEKMHESAAEKKRHEGKGFREYYKKYSTPEQRAGHRYNISKKHREAESRGMKKAMRKHNDMMHEMNENPMYYDRKAYYGMGYDEPSNLPQHVEHHYIPEPYPKLKEDYPDTIMGVDHEYLRSFKKLEEYPSDSMY